MHTNGRRAPFSAAGFNSFSPFAFRLVLGCRGEGRRKKKKVDHHHHTAATVRLQQ